MKSPYFLSTLLLFFYSTNFVSAQANKELPAGYYVVVAAYAATRENVAQNYKEVLNRRGIKADYGFNSRRNHYYVYLNYFTDLKTSLRDMTSTRKTPEFAEAWVRVISGDVTATTTSTEISTQKSPDAASKVIESNSTTAVAGQEQEQNSETTVTPKSNVKLTDSSYDDVTENPEIIQYSKITLENTEVFLSLYNARNNRIVEGNVKVIDTDKSKLIKEVKGNDYLNLPDPKNTSGKITLICEAFGYRKVQHELSYPLPLADTIKEYVDLLGTTFIVYFDLVRYHKGDIGTLFHVYFYNDAAIMLPESKYELTSLKQMMEENPKYRVMLHGHTNGNYHGRIILPGDNTNFFSLDGSKNTVGSAKDLARARAEIIRDYLIANGIDGSRIEVKSWGGKKPLYDRHGANAKKNVRVEVEILDE
jgi:outer membrane protein OmpA-like peptidoglycan-associated protein